MSNLKIEKEKNRIMNQVNMILNLSDNLGSNEYQTIADIFEIYKEILFGHGKSESFLDSIENSKQLAIRYYHDEKIHGLSKYLEGLENNKKDSFLISPIHADGHLFCSIIKIVDKKYNVILANMDGNPRHKKYEEYTFENKIDLNNFFKYSNKIKTEEVYMTANNLSSNKNLLFIDSKDQVIGNCFLKELEKAIKFASYTDGKSNIDITNLEAVIYPKWPESTIEIHRKYIDKIKEKYKNLELEQEITSIFDSYTESKKFMDNPLTYNINSKFLNSKCMSPRYQNFPIIKNISKDNNYNELRDLYVKSRTFKLDKDDFSEIERLLTDKNIEEKYTALVKELKLSIVHTLKVNGQDKFKNKNYNDAIEYTNLALKFYPNNASLHKNLSSYYKKTSQYKKASEHNLIYNELSPQKPILENKKIVSKFCFFGRH